MQDATDVRLNTVLYLGLGRVIQIGYHWNSRLHKHNAIALIFSKTPFYLRFEDSDWQTCSAIIINSNIIHEVKYPDNALVSCRIVPFRKRGQDLQNHILKGARARIISYSKAEPFLNEFYNSISAEETGARIFHICEKMLDSFSGINNGKTRMDPRIVSVMNNIQKKLQQHISAREMAASVFLSEDRFLHLFKEQIGIPLRQYILYQRTMFAANAFLNGHSVCQAAQLAGFADCAHFTRSFVDINGLKPSDIMKFQDKIDTHICTSTSCMIDSENSYAQECSDCRFFIS